MIRQESLEEISDGKLYSENDCVKADTGNCAGCRQVCCKGMEASIVLDPYDVYRLTQKTGKSFNELISDKIEINIVDGIMLPNMRMDPDTNACGFLLSDNRCARCFRLEDIGKMIRILNIFFKKDSATRTICLR